MNTNIRLLLIILPLSVLSACASNIIPVRTTETLPIPSPSPTAKLAITGNATELASNCTPDKVASLITSFVEAFNAGDRARLEQFFEPTFEWYSVTVGTQGEAGYSNFTTSSRDELLTYFLERHDHQEHFTLLTIEVKKSWHEGADIIYTGTVSADDRIAATSEFMGKGAVSCNRQMIFVWSMAIR